MVDTQNTIRNAAADSSKRRQQECAVFFICKTQMISTGTEMSIPEETFFVAC